MPTKQFTPEAIANVASNLLQIPVNLVNHLNFTAHAVSALAVDSSGKRRSRASVRSTRTAYSCRAAATEARCVSFRHLSRSEDRSRVSTQGRRAEPRRQPFTVPKTVVGGVILARKPCLFEQRSYASKVSMLIHLLRC